MITVYLNRGGGGTTDLMALENDTVKRLGREMGGGVTWVPNIYIDSRAELKRQTQKS